MKITTFYEDGEANDYEYDNFVLKAINDKGEHKTFSIGAGEPEDMYLFRDLSDALSVPDLMYMAYEAGKNGESFEVMEVDSEDKVL